MTIRWPALVVLGFVAGAACAGAARLVFVEPTVDLTEVRIAGLGLRGGTLNLVVDVDNPNPYDIRGLGLETAVDLDGTAFGEAVWEETWNLAAGERTTVEIPLQFTWEGVGAGARSLLRTGAVPYTLRGTLRISSPLGEHPVGVATSGSVSLRDIVR